MSAGNGVSSWKSIEKRGLLLSALVENVEGGVEGGKGCQFRGGKVPRIGNFWFFAQRNAAILGFVVLDCAIMGVVGVGFVTGARSHVDSTTRGAYELNKGSDDDKLTVDKGVRVNR